MLSVAFGVKKEHVLVAGSLVSSVPVLSVVYAGVLDHVGGYSSFLCLLSFGQAFLSSTLVLAAAPQLLSYLVVYPQFIPLTSLELTEQCCPFLTAPAPCQSL